MGKRRAYVRLPDQVLREPWDDATLADIVRLQCWLNQRWARDGLTADEAGTAFLGPQDMMLVTRTSNATRSRRRLLDLQERSAGVSLSVVEATRGRINGVNIEWRKFAQEQGYFDREVPKLGPDKAPPPPPPPPPPHTHTQEEEEESVAGARAPRRAPSRRRKRSLEDLPEPAVAFARRFRTALARVHEGFKEPSEAVFVQWADAARLMHEQDHRAWDEATELAAWLFAGATEDARFWRRNVLSLGKFRKQYDAMQAQRRDQGGEVIDWDAVRRRLEAEETG